MAANIDWDDVTRETTDLLSRYIAIDTSNPPGNEMPAAQFLAGVLRENGIDSTLFPLPDNRANLVARLTGSGDKKPLVLLNHMDVVPAQPEFWQEPPFSGVVKDGSVWGRGAVDMKGMGVLELMTLLLLRRQNVPLSRDIVFMACADEEVGGDLGIEWLDREHPELLEADYVINEGAYGSTEMFGLKKPVFSCSLGEKGPLWLRLRAEGRPGHASVPHGDNALERLVRALDRVLAWERAVDILPELRPTFEFIRRSGVLGEDSSEEAMLAFARRIPPLNALITDTISLTMCGAGVKANVIPASAEATLDCRLLPGHDPEEFKRRLTEVVDDPKIQIEQVLHQDASVSKMDSGLYRAIEESIRELVPDAALIPSIAPGFTDSRVFRKRGVTAYGFVPCLLHPFEIASAHGHNERISVEALRLGAQLLYRVVRRLAG